MWKWQNSLATWSDTRWLSSGIYTEKNSKSILTLIWDSAIFRKPPSFLYDSLLMNYSSEVKLPDSYVQFSSLRYVEQSANNWQH